MVRARLLSVVKRLPCRHFSLGSMPGISRRRESLVTNATWWIPKKKPKICTLNTDFWKPPVPACGVHSQGPTSKHHLARRCKTPERGSCSSGGLDVKSEGLIRHRTPRTTFFTQIVNPSLYRACVGYVQKWLHTYIYIYIYLYTFKCNA